MDDSKKAESEKHTQAERHTTSGKRRVVMADELVAPNLGPNPSVEELLEFQQWHLENNRPLPRGFMQEVDTRRKRNTLETPIEELSEEEIAELAELAAAQRKWLIKALSGTVAVCIAVVGISGYLLLSNGQSEGAQQPKKVQPYRKAQNLMLGASAAAYIRDFKPEQQISEKRLREIATKIITGQSTVTAEQFAAEFLGPFAEKESERGRVAIFISKSLDTLAKQAAENPYDVFLKENPLLSSLQELTSELPGDFELSIRDQAVVEAANSLMVQIQVPAPNGSDDEVKMLPVFREKLELLAAGNDSLERLIIIEIHQRLGFQKYLQQLKTADVIEVCKSLGTLPDSIEQRRKEYEEAYFRFIDLRSKTSIAENSEDSKVAREILGAKMKGLRERLAILLEGPLKLKLQQSTTRIVPLLEAYLVTSSAAEMLTSRVEPLRAKKAGMQAEMNAQFISRR